MKKFLFILIIFSTFIAKAQDFNYQILFEGIGDNREFTAPLATPETILGTRGAFELGIDIDNHRLRGGLSHLFEFGTDMNAQLPKLTLYYQYKDEKNEFIFGAFPRRNKINFPLAMLSDTLQYFRPNIEGFFGEVSWDWGHQNGFVDWVGRQTETQREQFMAGFSGEIVYKNLFFQNYILLFHNAHTLYNNPPLHIEDNLGYAFQAGIKTGSNSIIQGDIKAGILTSMFRERGVTDGFVTSTSLFAEVNGRVRNFGIKSVLSSAGSHIFTYGDSFYQAKDYLRTDIIWYFINHKNVKGRFNYSLHCVNWDYIDQQQQLSVIYVFGK